MARGPSLLAHHGREWPDSMRRSLVAVSVVVLVNSASGTGSHGFTAHRDESDVARVIAKFKQSGLSRLAVSLDGSCKEIHDTFRKVDGSFEWTVESIRAPINPA